LDYEANLVLTDSEDESELQIKIENLGMISDDSTPHSQNNMDELRFK
jgi:hypothetical protein